MDGGKNVFISAVTNEFGQLRRALSTDFRVRQMRVEVHEDLSALAAPGTLLAVLEAHLKRCAGGVFVIGDRSGGGYPTDSEAKPYFDLLPATMPRASYTQWEFLIGWKLGLKMIVLRPAPGGDDPDVPADKLAEPDDTALQNAFIAHVESLGVRREDFTSLDQACRKVMREPWVLADPATRIHLPYPSIGSLFKGRDAFLTLIRHNLTSQNGGTAAIVAQGMGGIGKTRAAVEYAWAHREDYAALLFLNAETPDRLNTGLGA